jgi:hypothetical protein
MYSKEGAKIKCPDFVEFSEKKENKFGHTALHPGQYART